LIERVFRELGPVLSVTSDFINYTFLGTRPARPRRSPAIPPSKCLSGNVTTGQDRDHFHRNHRGLGDHRPPELS
jgi:hypothetical protein